MSDFDLPITAMSPTRHRAAVTVLVNQERANAGMPALHYAASLSASARAWSYTMVNNSNGSHGNWAKRVLRLPSILAGKPRRRAVAENIAYGTGILSTPRAIVAQWMASEGHRKNILGDRRWGAVWSSNDTPEPGKQADGVTVVQHFGRNVT